MSTPIPTFDPEDPKLTAYALGELTDPAECAEVELLLQHSPEAQLAMKEIQDLTQTLTAEYDQERQAPENPETPGDQPANVINLADRLPGPHWIWVRPVFAVAAVLLIVAVLAGLSLPVFNSVQVRGSHRAVNVARAHLQPGATAVPESMQPQTQIDLLTKSGERVTSVPAAELGADLSPRYAAKAPVPAAPDAERVVVTGSNIPRAEEVGSAPVDAVDPAAVGREPGNVYGLSSPLPQNAALPPLTANTLQPGSAPQGGVPKALAGQARGGALYGDDANGGLAGKPLAFGKTSSAAPVERATRVFRSDTEFYRAKSGLSNGPLETRYRAEMSNDRDHLGLVAEDKRGLRDQRDSDAALRLTRTQPEFNTAAYDHVVENPFLGAKENPLSTFSIDVDTASYANVRRFIDGGNLPPAGAVRIEEMINYFPYDYAPPAADSDKPFAVHLEAASCPWAPEHRLVRVGIKGKEIAQDKRPASNLVFLLDVSGSMDSPERLPLIKKAMSMMVEHLVDSDRVAIVTYAGNSGLVLPSTDGAHKDTILASLDRLKAGGSTNGASGIELAYRTAKENFIKGGTNRVILATDGDFNVGVTSQGDLISLIQEQAKGGVFLSVLGVGTDNFKDSTMQKLADKGNGNYNYLDRLEEARKVLVDQMGGTLVTIAKDVKIQVEFNPAVVGSYRLVGYEKRMLRKEDFNNDKIDAGEIGAGHSVTALYEVVPVRQAIPDAAPAVDALKYGPDAATAATAPARPIKVEESASTPPADVVPKASATTEMLTVKLRHKAPDADKSERTYEVPFLAGSAEGDFAKASTDFRFAAAVAEFGLVLRGSPYAQGSTLGSVVELAQESKGADPKGYRAGFIELARRAQSLKNSR